ncbi:hypothetical protein LWC33_30080 [Pseudonocardia sp. RS11V-5]|uniref:hypothetical protein n=1 Tax=Pseudonocardia terrae TaxID=2905831 RepID=UPI001E2C3853|nr:hypothetical protein [Pseudonocardia terrae]MCE3555680.1 hypothetical protein [Pseudonocardia terrae]
MPLTACPGDDHPHPFLLAAGGRDTILPFAGAPRAHPPTVGVQTAVADLRGQDRCVAAPERSASGGATVSRWTGCADGTSVELVVYPSSGHTWPPSAAGLMWSFLTGASVPAPTAPATATGNV